MRWSIILSLLLFQSLNLYKADTYDRLVGSSYDTLLRKRFVAPETDPSIVILDIDERSLQQMSTDHGRWPWPRDTLASVLEYLEKSGAAAVVFDILFSDEDVINQVADATFADSVTRSSSSFFPVLRLDQSLDKFSEVNVTMLPGFATPLNEKHTKITDSEPRVAVIPPVFEAVISTGRLGFHNMYPDVDGVNRHYRLWEDIGSSWRLNSLPVRMAHSFGWSLPAAPNQLMSFQLKPDAYPTVSFFDVWVASQRRESHSSSSDFKDKIVIIGSTAPNLFDIKVTPLSPIQPGVQVLANAIDNLKNGDFVRTLDKSAQWLIGAALLLLMVYGSKKLSVAKMRWAILLAPSGLIGVSFLVLNFGDVFIDQTAAASQAFIFFTSMTLYASWRNQFFSTPPRPRSNDMFCTSIVFAAKATSLNLNEVIDAINRMADNYAILQSGFTAGTTVGVRGPYYAILLSPDKISESAMRTSLYIGESSPCIFKVDHMNPELTEFLSEADTLSDLAWPFIGRALIQWEKGDDRLSIT